MKRRIWNVARTLGLVVTAALIVSGVLAPALVSAQDPSPQSILTYRTFLLTASNGITQATNSSAVLMQAYGIADCYSIVDVTDSQTLTAKLQHSADQTNWVDLYTFTAASADGVAFTRTTIYGNYMRAVSTLGTANPVTWTVRCSAKNN